MLTWKHPCFTEKKSTSNKGFEMWKKILNCLQKNHYICLRTLNVCIIGYRIYLILSFIFCVLPLYWNTKCIFENYLCLKNKYLWFFLLFWLMFPTSWLSDELSLNMIDMYIKTVLTVFCRKIMITITRPSYTRKVLRPDVCARCK